MDSFFFDPFSAGIFLIMVVIFISLHNFEMYF